MFLRAHRRACIVAAYRHRSTTPFARTTLAVALFEPLRFRIPMVSLCVSLLYPRTSLGGKPQMSIQLPCRVAVYVRIP
jgi:hypothetical protein